MKGKNAIVLQSFSQRIVLPLSLIHIFCGSVAAGLAVYLMTCLAPGGGGMSEITVPPVAGSIQRKVVCALTAVVASSRTAATRVKRKGAVLSMLEVLDLQAVIIPL